MAQVHDAPLATPLADRHQALGARIVEFGGWLMPLQYAGILEEHRAVRSRAGLFDLSHMGELFVEGSEAAAALGYALTTEPAGLKVGRAQYSMICFPGRRHPGRPDRLPPGRGAVHGRGQCIECECGQRRSGGAACRTARSLGRSLAGDRPRRYPGSAGRGHPGSADGRGSGRPALLRHRPGECGRSAGPDRPDRLHR